MVFVATAIVKETPHPGIAQMIASRAERARDLFFSRRQRIQRIGEDVYSVPGSAGQRYAVHYGGPEGVEGCECTDWQVHGPHIPCKHLQVVALQYAVRRAPRGARTVEIPVAGDPFVAARDDRLRELEDRLRHEDLDVDERAKLSDEVARLMRRQRSYGERRSK